MKIGRNAPCPCGSGKKYKKCCGFGTAKKPKPTRDLANVELNRHLAYAGKVGKARQAFCEMYLERKRTYFDEMKIFQEKLVAELNEVIQCSKGCHYCCAQYIGGSLQECEAIVYYLYQNKNAFKYFLRQYPAWRTEIKKHEPVLQRMGNLFNEGVLSGWDENSREKHLDGGGDYLELNIFCAFLRNKECLIYPVRPRSCASLIATTPSEWCSPLNENVSNQILAGSYELDPPYFYGPESALLMTKVPITVYEILKGGFIYLSNIPGLQGIDEEALRGPEAQGILRQLGI